MGRRSEHTPEALKFLIIEASEQIIAADGLAGLSAREIARRVGYSPGTIYNIFQNLDDLVLQIEARLLDDLDARLAKLPPAGLDGASVLRLAQEYLTFTTERPRLWNILFEHHMPASSPVPDWYRAKLDALLGRVESVLKPVIPDTDPAAAARSARVLWASVHGITSLATTDKLSNITADSAQALMNDLVLNYLAGLQHRRVAEAV